MNKSQTISVGIFFLLGIALLWIVHSQLSVKTVEGYKITGRFETLLQLRAGDDVRMAGVRIGSVESTGLDGRKPTAVFKINEEFNIPEDSVATIGMAGLLGNNMVSIQMGTSNNYLPHDGDIKTDQGYDINNVVNQIGALSQQIGGALNNFEKILGSQEGEEGIFQTLSRMLRENQDAIRNTVANIETITDQIASGKGTIGKLVMDDEMYNELKTLSDDLKRTLSEGEGLLSDTREIVTHVKSGEGTLGGLIYGDSNLTAEVEGMIAELKAFSEKLNNPNSTIGKLLTDDELYGELQGTLRKANQTLDGMGDSAPISAVGAVAAPLF